MDNIRITIESNAEDAAKTFEQLAQSFNNTAKDSQDLRKQIKALKDELYKLDPATEEYAETLNLLGEKMDTLNDITAEVKAASGGLDTVFQTTTSAVSTMASGFSAASGVVALFGGDASDLQETFVKLQAVMSIATGLKGVSGFFKETEKASISMKAFINKLRLSKNAVDSDTKSKVSDTMATKGLDTAQKEAAGSTSLLTAGFKKLTAAIASNPIGALLVALTAAIAGISSWIKHTKEAEVHTRNFNQVIYDEKVQFQDIAEEFQALDKEFDKYISKREQYGATQEQLNEVSEEYWKNVLKEAEATAKAMEADYQRMNMLNRTVILLQYGMKSSKEFREEIDKYIERVQQAKDELENLASAKNPFAGYTAEMKKEMDKMDVLIAEGLASTRDKYLKMIEIAEKGKRDVLAKYAGTHGRKISQDDQDTINKYNTEIEGFLHQIEIIDAGARKKVADEVKKNREALAKNADALAEDINKNMNDVLDAFGKVLAETSKLNLSGENMIGIFYTKLNEALYKSGNGGLDDIIDNLRDNIDKSLKEEKITQAEADKLYAELDVFGKKYEANIKELVNKIASTHFSFDGQNTFDLTPYFEKLNEQARNNFNEVQRLKEETEKIRAAYDEGLISPEMFRNWMMQSVKEFESQIPAVLESIPETVEKVVESMSTGNKEQDEQIKNALAAYLRTSIQLPPGFIAGMKDEVKNQVKDDIEYLLDEIENEYQHVVDKYTKEKEQNEAFEKFYEKLWGGGEIPYDDMRKNLEDQLKAYKDIYDKEVSALDLEYSGFAKGSVEYEEYMKKRKELDAEWAKTHAEIVQKMTDLDRQNILNILNVVSAGISALSSFGSAMQSYYDDMANNEAKTEEERKKYTIKGLRMQELQAVATVAQGIVSAIATAYQVPAPYGAILAAIQAASVAAAGAVQIAVIEKQIQRAGGSGSSSSTNNPSGLVDRVIMGEAQNADQQAQLNGEYNQGSGATRVFVTTEDINAKQGETKTAVTNNTF